eukprot:3104799-Pleurochrysis_carterae.AAC.2
MARGASTGLRNAERARRLVARNGARSRALKGTIFTAFVNSKPKSPKCWPLASLHLIGAVTAFGIRGCFQFPRSSFASS